MLTISSGYDPGYLTRPVATGRENYYLSAVAEHGEPPGIWTGLGCPELGLPVGSQVDNKVMERLYGAFLDPRDPEGTATLGRAPSEFNGTRDAVVARITELLAAEPEATAERRDEIIMQALKRQRATVFFFDATFSVPKSVSLLHASLQVRAEQARQAGQAGEAEQWSARARTVWDAIMAGNQAMLGYLQREAGYSRAGYHSKDSGRFVDAHEWVIASFAQHTSRDNDPQLHVHNAILNRVLREDPLASRPGDQKAWRTLDGVALYAARPAAAAVAERTMGEYLSSRLGVEMVPRPDGNGWEIAGISEAVREQFSSRRRTIAPQVRQLADEYQQRHGRVPNARALWSMAQFITLDSRQPKAHSAPSRETLLEGWEAQSRRAETEALSAIPGAALGRLDARAEAGVPSRESITAILAAAVADAQQHKATFSRYDLIRMINRHLPGFLGGLSGDQVTSLLDELADEALRPGGPSGIVQLTAPEMVPVPQAYRRADGLSLWRRHGAEVFTTSAQLDTETRLLHAAAQTGAPRLAPERAAAALGADRDRIEARLWRDHAQPGTPDGANAAPDGAEPALSSAGLADDQAQAAYGILTSGRGIDILIGPAGTGKTRTVARIAQAWRQAGIGRVIGLTVSTNAAHALAAEGLTDSHNLARFLGRTRDGSPGRGHLPVRRGDLLVVDEASMVPTADVAAVEAIATHHGAKILLTGDTEQLSSVDAGGAMRLLAGEHGYYQLLTVQRFEHAWEREASLRLRAGDSDALADYDLHGRILQGTREQMADAAVGRWLADHLSGHVSVLLATTNEQAADLARRARDELAALGLVATSDLAELADGNVVGVGDLIVARQNAHIRAGEPDRWLANRDVLRIDEWTERGEARVALVRRMIGHDQTTRQTRWSAPFTLAESYISEHADLAYAGNVHAAEGRSVDTGHLVVDDSAGRAAQYVGTTRGRERNTFYVVTEHARAADISPQIRPSPDITDPGAHADERRRTNRFAILTTVLEREQADLSATETMRRELDKAASLAALAPIWAEVTRTHATRRYDSLVQSLLPAAEWQQYEYDPERGTLLRLLRAAELAGHDINEVLRTAAMARDFTGARSIAAVMHGRVRRIVGTPEPQTVGGYAARTPQIEDPDASRLARELAAAMDERVAVLGQRAAMDRPPWALRYLGEVPADPAARAEWTRRAGAAAAYREERGYAHDSEAIGLAPERGSPELRASWHAAFTALRMPDEGREVAAATDGELRSRRAAYARDAAWAPPYVADELREAYLAEDGYRAAAVHAWHRADAAASQDERAQARQEARQLSALAQDVGAYREQLTEVDRARRRWHAATELDRQRALSADTELRRRHPGTDLPLLHSESDMDTPDNWQQANGPIAVSEQAQPSIANGQGAGNEVPERGPGSDSIDAHPGPGTDQAQYTSGPGAALRTAGLDIQAALQAARQAEAIIAARASNAELADDDIMRRRQADAQQDAEARRRAVRQEPAPSHRAHDLDRDEPEVEAGL
jgi:conjugative relaxase-like TrwC/TraI family protein